jgi:hypothetical protein
MVEGTSDESLLARLNALRPSNITLQRTAPVDLSQRFKDLRTGSPIPTKGDANTEIVNTEKIQSPLGESDKQEVARILTELKGESKISQTDLVEWDTALKEAETVIREYKSREAEASKLHDKSENRGNETTEQDFSMKDAHTVTEEDIDKLLEEMNLAEITCEDQEHDEESDNDQDGGSVLQLPDTPSGLKSLPPRNDEDFGISLPSVPSAAPRSQASRVVDSANILLPRGEPKDADVESWCIICCDDATLRCLGCDGDLYCGNCWNEGHRGPDVGPEERSHRALNFVKDKKKPQKTLV